MYFFPLLFELCRVFPHIFVHCCGAVSHNSGRFIFIGSSPVPAIEVVTMVLQAADVFLNARHLVLKMGQLFLIGLIQLRRHVPLHYMHSIFANSGKIFLYWARGMVWRM